MEIKNRSTKLFTMVITLAAISVIWMTWLANRSAARDETGEEFLAYGVTSISSGQTARLHMVSVGISDLQIVDLQMFDTAGNLLTHSTDRIVPGSAVSLDLPFSEQSGVTTDRLEFYAVVQFLSPRGRDKGYLIPSLEVIDDITGKTIHIFVDPVA